MRVTIISALAMVVALSGCTTVPAPKPEPTPAATPFLLTEQSEAGGGLQAVFKPATLFLVADACLGLKFATGESFLARFPFGTTVTTIDGATSVTFPSGSVYEVGDLMVGGGGGELGPAAEVAGIPAECQAASVVQFYLPHDESS